MANTIKIGWGRRSLAPDCPVPITGQFALRVSQGIYTPVFASCLLLENGEDIAAFISCDMVAVVPDVLRKTQEILKREIPGFSDAGFSRRGCEGQNGIKRRASSAFLFAAYAR